MRLLLMPESLKEQKENRMPFDSLDDIRTFCRDLPKGDRLIAELAVRRQHCPRKDFSSTAILFALAVRHWRKRIFRAM